MNNNENQNRRGARQGDDQNDGHPDVLNDILRMAENGVNYLGNNVQNLGGNISSWVNNLINHDGQNRDRRSTRRNQNNQNPSTQQQQSQSNPYSQPKAQKQSHTQNINNIVIKPSEKIIEEAIQKMRNAQYIESIELIKESLVNLKGT